MVVGSEKDIKEAKNLRKMMGGGMRQSGVLTACGIVALTDW
jgi:threonine aldolase